jgi:uroporphyrin-3 C-methyltransferase
VRLVDELPLHSNALAVARANAAAASRAAGSAASSPASAAGGLGVWADRLGLPLGKVWDALADLVRVRRIDQPEAMLLAPEQAYFLRENIKLRLLNARLALLSRQTEVAQNDISAVMAAVGTYFDPVAKRTQVAQELLKQVQAQTRQVNLPRPDETLAAIAAALAGR